MLSLVVVDIPSLLVSETAEESIDESSCMQQVFQRTECCRGWRADALCRRGQVGPIGRNQRFTAIGQDQNEKQTTFPMHGPENVERSAFEGMTSADNGDLLGKVLVMGSVS